MISSTSSPLVWLRLPGGGRAALGHGDFIGRVWSAALVIDDPRVSEGHAMISLRGGELWMLALRRKIAVDGRAVSELRLAAGQKIHLAEQLVLTVEEVELPDRVLAVRCPGWPAVGLPAVAALRGRPTPALVARLEPDAPCVIWTTGDGWRRRDADGADHPLRAGDEFDVDGVTFTAVELELGGGGVTRRTGGVDAPLRVRACYDTAQVQRGNEPPLLLSGQPARLLSELVALGGPAPWDVVAGELWPDEADATLLRKRFDVLLGRLRARLREARIGADRVRTTGTGQVELVLLPGDVVEDLT